MCRSGSTRTILSSAKALEFEVAPLEGITDAVYRRTHAAFYPGAARYYTPFISPTMNHIFTPRDLRELNPENNPGLELVPQLLGRNPSDLIWAAKELCAMGYTEFNLNLGCPSGTVTAKRKGSGLLAFPEELDALLCALFRACDMHISVKTRLGTDRPEEFSRILAIYEQYPICRLIVHPRTRADQYYAPVRLDVFRMIVETTRLPLCYNGDLFTTGDAERFMADFPSVGTVMLGRGIAADPGFIRRLQGDHPNLPRLRAFHDTLCREYVEVFGSENSAMQRMKAIWTYMLPRLSAGEKNRKRLVKTRRWDDFLAATMDIFSESEPFDVC